MLAVDSLRPGWLALCTVPLASRLGCQTLLNLDSLTIAAGLACPVFRKANGMYWKLALIRGNLLSQTTAHTVVQSLRSPLLQRNMAIAFIFPYSFMVRSHLLLETVHVTIWRSFCIILVRVLVLYYGVLLSVFTVLNWDLPGLHSCI